MDPIQDLINSLVTNQLKKASNQYQRLDFKSKVALLEQIQVQFGSEKSLEMIKNIFITIANK